MKKVIKKIKRKAVKKAPASLDLNKIARKLTAKRNSSLVMFDFEKPLDLSQFTQNELRINVVGKIQAPFNISIGESALDVYFSPHVLNLAEKKQIEKIKPKLKKAELVELDDPFYRFGQKLYLFDLLDIEKSEILNYFKRIFSKTWQAKNSLKGGKLETKLPIERDERLEKIEKDWPWYEISFINLAIFIYNSLIKAANLIFNAFHFSKTAAKNISSLVKDESYHLENHTAGQLVFSESVTSIDIRPSNFNNSPIAFYENEKYHTAELFPTKAISFNEIKKIKKKKEKIASYDYKTSLGEDLKPIFWPYFLKLSISFTVIAMLVVLPLKLNDYWSRINETKGRVLGEADLAINNLDEAKNKLISFDFAGAQAGFSEANKNFISAENQLKGIKSFLTFLAESVPTSNSYKSGVNLIELGENLSSAGEILMAGANILSLNGDENGWLDKIKAMQSVLDKALPEIIAANDNADKVDLKHLPLDKREAFNSIKKALPIFVSSLKQSKEISNFALTALADKSLKRYLIVFQNDNELRATGGFIGSYALVDIENGKIKNIEIPKGGSYDLRAGLKELIKAPEPMLLVNDTWELQDSNWWPDWPTSAKAITWFYNKSGGPSVDGVIAINSAWLGELLNVTGPIEMPEYGKTLTSLNFETELQKSIEVESTNKKEPKKILSDATPKIIEKLFSIEPTGMVKLLTTVNKGLEEKDLQLYMTDSEMQKFVEAHGWDGRLKEAPSDFLAVVSTNIAGGKTDGVIDQEIFHNVDIASDGSITDTAMISRHHFGPTDPYFTKEKNRSYIRIYVPKGSQLVKAAGFIPPFDEEFKSYGEFLKEDSRLRTENNAQIDLSSQTKTYEENGKTVFANWLNLNPGESQDAIVVYKLPFKLGGDQLASESGLNKLKMALMNSKKEINYSLLVQKQSGSNTNQFVSTINLANNWKVTSKYPEKITGDNNSLRFSSKLETDQSYTLQLQK